MRPERCYWGCPSCWGWERQLWGRGGVLGTNAGGPRSCWRAWGSPWPEPRLGEEGGGENKKNNTKGNLWIEIKTKRKKKKGK